ncbi:MAG: hypothetical protein D3923_03005 [Candidatus Electrothrix sp. AR3]|nr:hypothetical protein [Candidatus Electrothrix sp. AR3]
MATPHHTPLMEPLDQITVTLYRIGLSIFALSAILHTIELLSTIYFMGKWYLPLMATGAAMASANIHLYDPKFRWFFPLMSWIGFIILGFAMQVESAPIIKHLEMLSLGFFYAGAGMFAVKESFCFKIPGLPLVPLFLAGTVLLRWSGVDLAAGITLVPAALLYVRLAYAKWMMPLHFDIGDKSQYSM